jgi:putative ABC transport system permease protein
MFKNYIAIACRNLIRHKAFAAINISGLAVGIAACLILFMVVRYETTYDTQQPNYSRIMHVVTQDSTSDGVDYTSGIPYPALEALRSDLPQTKVGSLFATYGSQITVSSTESDNKKFIEDYGIFFSDPEYFDVFEFKWLAGDKNVLGEPNMVVLSKSQAVKYFNSWQNAMGKSIIIDNALTVRVAGILEDASPHSDFPLRIVASFITMKNNPSIYGYSTEWGSTTSNYQLFMLLPEHTTQANIDAQLKTLSAKYYPREGRSSIRTNFLQPLKDIHSDNRFNNLGTHITTSDTIRTLTLVALLVIIMACINFINLSTAQAVSRSKEVGVRKVLGGSRSQLFGQMMGETFIVVLVASIFALVISLVALPFVKHIVSIEENLPLFSSFNLFLLSVIVISVTLLSGFYPSLILSGFKPALALKNKITSASVGGLSLRRGLVIMQFGISQVLIIGTIVAVSQMDFVRKADLGFNKEAVLVLSANGDNALQSRLPAFKNYLLQQPGIQSLSFSSDVPSSDNNWGTNFAFDHKPDEKFTLFLKYGDEDYFKTYGLQLAAGRSFQKSDTLNELVINEALVRRLGFKDPNEVIGKELRMGGGSWHPVVGVAKDFKTNSLRDEIKPLLIGTRKRYYSQTGIKLRTSNLTSAQATVQKAWDKFFPEYAFASSFMDERIENFYQQEQQLSLLYKIFAGLAIVISCLGLYGLVSYMAVQKVKEVGVRKVLGASVGNIVYLFSKEFTVLIALAFAIAAPVAYYMMNSWLNNFQYKVKIGFGVFTIAILISVIIAWATVGYKAFRAALVNPVKSLRSE